MTAAVDFRTIDLRGRNLTLAALRAAVPRAKGQTGAGAEDKVLQIISAVRQRGFAIADQEHETGIRAVGVPVLGPDGHALAAISIASPSFRMSVEDCVDVVPTLTDAARRLALLLPSR